MGNENGNHCVNCDFGAGGLLLLYSSQSNQIAADRITDAQGTKLAFLGKEGKQKKLNGVNIPTGWQKGPGCHKW